MNSKKCYSLTRNYFTGEEKREVIPENCEPKLWMEWSGFAEDYEWFVTEHDSVESAVNYCNIIKRPEKI